MTGGDKFTVELSESAVQFKQDLNTIQENTLRNFAYSGFPGGLSDQNIAKLDELGDEHGDQADDLPPVSVRQQYEELFAALLVRKELINLGLDHGQTVSWPAATVR